MPRHELKLPDLGLDDQRVVVSLWLVKRGARVVEGGRLLEVLAGTAVIDLPAPVSGTLVETLVGTDDVVRVGQRLAVIEADEEPA
jgi:pyruvate/2-oxoglutarate dehydrogenase complex dihydrolipoamide acyltransferase (E2) component